MLVYINKKKSNLFFHGHIIYTTHLRNDWISQKMQESHMTVKKIEGFGSPVNKIKDTLKAFEDFKSKQKSVWNKVFRYVNVYISWKFVQHTIYWDKKQLWKMSFGQNKRYKYALFFLQDQTHYSLTFNLWLL